MIGTLWTLFGGAGLVTKLITIGVLAVSLLAAYGIWHHKVYQRGVNDTLAKIAKADAKTVARALQFRSVLKDCQARGLGWDQSTGACK